VVLFVSQGPAAVQVRDVAGRTVGDASDLLEADGFKVTTTSESSDTIASGRVIRTEPAAGSQKAKGATVTLVGSSGSSAKDVPNVVGLSPANAVSTLQNAGFKVNIDNQEVLDPAKDGKVLSQSPSGTKTAPSGSTVTIVVGQAIGGGTDGDATTTTT
jgi:serine/threonine-protein kinase